MQRPARYSTAEVAQILATEDWRVKNFALPAYGIEPTVKAKGRGHRTNYGFDALLRLAVANELYEACLSPDGVRGADTAVQEQEAIQEWTASFDHRAKPSLLMLTLSEKRNKQTSKLERIWKVLGSKQAASELEEFSGRGLVFMCLNLSALWKGVVDRITELEASGEI